MRSLALALGMATLAAAWLGPLPSGAGFSSHMLMHMLVVAVGAPLVAIGIAGSRVDPARRWPWLFLPVPASLLEMIVVWGWHAPVLHHAARHSTAMLVVEQASFVAVGLLVWIAAVGGERSSGEASRGRTAAGIAGLLLTSMHMTLLGVLLALAGRPLYAHAGATPFGWTALEDQQVGGVLMLLFGGISYLAGGLLLLVDLLRERRAADASR